MDTVEIIIDEEIKPEKAQGVPWEKVKFKIDAKKFAKLMRDNHIETLQDVQKDPQTVVRILQNQYGVDLGAVLTFAKEYEEGE